VTPETLRDAVRSGNREQVESILKEDPDLIKSKCGPDRVTLLHGAASLGHAELLVYLLECGAEVDARDRWGRTPLTWAVAFGRKNTVELLLTHAATIDLADNLGTTPLHCAAFRGQEDLVELFLSRGADANSTDNGGYDALYYAASGGQINVAKLLLNLGLDMNSRSNDGWTALHTAAYRGHLEMVEWLTENGAEVNASNSRRQTPLFWAANGYSGSAADTPPNMSGGETKEHAVGKEDRTKSNNVEVVKFLLARGGDVNVSDDQGWTPLQAAAHSDDLEVIKLLLAANAPVNARNNEGWTALCVAAKHGHAGVVKLLLDRGADAGIKVKGIYTPLNYAVLDGRRKTAELLLATEPQTRTDAGPRCPGCRSKKQILITAPLFVSDTQTRTTLRCTVCGAIWAKRKIEWRGSFKGVIAILAAAFFGFEVFRDLHGISFLRIAMVELWIWMGIQEFSKHSERSCIWVKGAPEGAATS